MADGAVPAVAAALVGTTEEDSAGAAVLVVGLVLLVNWVVAK